VSNRRKAKNPPTSPASGLPDEPFFLACVDMVGRTGAKTWEIRESEPEHKGSPKVWVAIAGYTSHGKWAHLVDASLAPTNAVFKLLEQAVDGNECQHCKRPAGITADFKGMPVPEAICWYQFDPELSSFRRGCE
jgi:hypothetical protein